MVQKPYLNLGCGRVILPAERPAHHESVDPTIYSYPLWVNADRNAGPGVDEVVDLFRYPWPWDDNSFDAALLAHLVEHIPHAINSDDPRYCAMQDGWYAFLFELWRVLTPGAVAHIIAPYAFSTAAMTDPSHTRYITDAVFVHALDEHAGAPFRYETGGVHLAMIGDPVYRLTEWFAHLAPKPGDPQTLREHKQRELQRALATQVNVAHEICVRLRVVK